jgi:hypothetical protein
MPAPLEVERISVAGAWWRHSIHGADPLWLATPPSSGRWQQGTVVAAIYRFGGRTRPSRAQYTGVSV